jgi:histidine triad (HIT) family protein
MSDCLFCKIASGQIPAKLIHEDPRCVGFLDINPQAPTHALFIPRRHIATVNALTVEDAELVGHLVLSAAKYARDQGFSEAGYRLVMNTNADAGQTVFHVHLHVLAGRVLGWPPK